MIDMKLARRERTVKLEGGGLLDISKQTLTQRGGR